MSEDRAATEEPVAGERRARTGAMARVVEGATHKRTAWSAATIAGTLVALQQLGYLPTPAAAKPPPEAVRSVAPSCEESVRPLAGAVRDLADDGAAFRRRVVERLDDVERKVDALTTDQVQRFIWYSEDLRKVCRPGAGATP